MSPLIVPPLVLAAALVAYVISTGIVLVADRAGWCWSMQREERRHADDVWLVEDTAPVPAHRLIVSAAATAEDDYFAAVQRTLALPPPLPQPIRRRVLARRVALATGGH